MSPYQSTSFKQEQTFIKTIRKLYFFQPKAHEQLGGSWAYLKIKMPIRQKKSLLQIKFAYSLFLKSRNNCATKILWNKK